jgi:hypothetical protein
MANAARSLAHPTLGPDCGAGTCAAAPLDAAVDALDEQGLLGHLGALGALERRVHAGLVRTALALEERRVPAARGDRNLVQTLTSEGGVTRADAVRITHVARGVRELPVGPVVGAAVDSGRIGLAAAETILRADPRLHASVDALLESASTMDSAAFAAHVRDLETKLDDGDPDGERRRLRSRRSATERVGRDGMGVIRLELPPDAYALMRNAAHSLADEAWRRANPSGHSDTELPAEPYTALLADAYVELARRALRRTSELFPSRHDPVPEVLVITDLATLQGLDPDGRCHLDGYGRIPVSTARRLCCGADIRMAVIGASGEVLHLGRKVRTATHAQRHALLTRDGTTCAVRGCDVPWDQCQAHHIVPWEAGGTTDLDNLVHLCGGHHHLVHDDHWTLHHTGGVWTLRPPATPRPVSPPPLSRRRPGTTTPRRRTPGRDTTWPTRT